MHKKIIFPDDKDPEGFKLICFRALCYPVLFRQLVQGKNKAVDTPIYLGKNLFEIISKLEGEKSVY